MLSSRFNFNNVDGNAGVNNESLNQLMEEDSAVYASMNSGTVHVTKVDQYLNAILQSNQTLKPSNEIFLNNHNTSASKPITSATDSGDDSGFVTSNSAMSSPQSSPESSPMNTNTYNNSYNGTSNIYENYSLLSFQGVANSSNLTNLDQFQQLMSPRDVKLFSSYSSRSSLNAIELKILKQPESHHRARYMTEGSRGTIKDSSGRGYPVVQLIGYDKGAVKLECFIGHDQKIGEPHLFYQACEVSGKTPYKFSRVNGINIIELELLPKNNMQAIIDCIGILKERNVDVERKVLRSRRKGNKPSIAASEETRMIRSANKKRSSHCRMVFRCILPESGEILQAVSDPILCTQPLGTPEIYKMSLRECDFKGGNELYIIGKNFHKDSKVAFECGKHWKKVVVPQKEFLNCTHLICQIPAFDDMECKSLPMVTVNVTVNCNHKSSDPMRFIYTNSSVVSINQNFQQNGVQTTIPKALFANQITASNILQPQTTIELNDNFKIW